MRIRRIGVVVAALCVCLPSSARASSFMNLGLGVSFSSPSAQTRPSFVADVGWLPREPIGVELDVAYAPRFFKNSGSLTENRLTTVMGNVIIAGFDRGGRSGRRRRGPEIRPFVSGGFGLMGERVATAAPLSEISNAHLGLNIGVGVMALSRRTLGLRAEVRYFQDLVGTSISNATGIDFGSLHFVRASFGVVVAF